MTRALRPAMAVAVVLLSLSQGVTTGDEAAGLVVHEWGTFTSVLGDDGMPVAWRPFTASDDLPGFVYRLGASAGETQRPRGSIKTVLSAPARLETPVLYMYADHALSASARVRFPGGRITEWYPRADLAGEGIEWDSVEVQPGVDGGWPDEGQASHYYAARETDAASLRIEADSGPQEERFLFYRGAGHLDLSITAALDRGRVVVQSLQPGVREVVLFENRNGATGYSIRPIGDRPVAFARPLRSRSVFEIKSDLERILVRHGLYPKEAAAMVATWGDSWFEEGTRLFYVLPRALTDRALPLTISPRPARIVRVLVGRLELVLREDEDRARAELDGIPDVTSMSPVEKEEVRARLGRFGEPTLRRLRDRAHDPAAREKIALLLAP